MTNTGGYMKTIWFYGNDEKKLTSIAEMVGEELINRGEFVELIVHKEVREILGRGLKDSKEDKSTFTDRLGFIGNLLHRNDIFALIISSDASVEDRKLVKENYRNFIQVQTCRSESLQTNRDPLTDILLDNQPDPKTNAKKVIECLTKERLIPEDSQQVYSEDEEEEIRKRLEDLGYV